jgi:hypothetical protein
MCLGEKGWLCCVEPCHHLLHSLLQLFQIMPVTEHSLRFHALWCLAPAMGRQIEQM